MLNVTCARCGTTFGAQRKTAQYCSTKCKVAAVRARQREADSAPPAIQPRRDGARLVALEPKSHASDGLVATTERVLAAANRLDSYHGVVALYQARLLDSGVQDTMSSMAAMFREYKASMAEALAGVVDAETPLEKIRRERELKAG